MLEPCKHNFEMPLFWYENGDRLPARLYSTNEKQEITIKGLYGTHCKHCGKVFSEKEYYQIQKGS